MLSLTLQVGMQDVQTPIEGNLEFHMDLSFDLAIIPILIYLKTILAKV